MNQNKQEQWQTEFDEKFYSHFHGENYDYYFTESDIKQFISKTRQEAVEEYKTHLIQEFRQVTEVHSYLSGKDCEKVIRFIENLDKPQPEIALSLKKEE